MLDKISRWEGKVQAEFRLRAAFLQPFALCVHFFVREVGVVLAAAAALYCGSWRAACASFFAMSFGELANGAVKFATLEPRPVWVESALLHVATTKAAAAEKKTTTKSSNGAAWEQDTSFPSSHSEVTMVTAIAVAWALGWRSPLALAAFCLAVAAGLSRAYLGMHYFHDVLCGWALAWITAPLGLGFIDWVLSSAASRWPVAFVAAFLFLVAPTMLDVIIRVVPEPPRSTVEEWERRARLASGKHDGHIVLRETWRYVGHAVSCAGILIAFGTLSALGVSAETFAGPCAAGTPWFTKALALGLRVVLGLPALLFVAGAQGFAEMRPWKNALLLLSVLWGEFLVFPFVSDFLGAKC